MSTELVDVEPEDIRIGMRVAPVFCDDARCGITLLRLPARPMFETVQQLLRSRMDDDTVAMMHGDRTWTWREHLAEAAAEASALIALADPSRPMHVGALLGNTPAMLRSMAAAALGGYVLCGINTTRRGDGLAADIRRADCQLVLADAEHMPLLDGLDLGGATVIDVDGPAYRDAVRSGETACAASGSRRRRTPS